MFKYKITGAVDLKNYSFKIIAFCLGVLLLGISAALSLALFFPRIGIEMSHGVLQGVNALFLFYGFSSFAIPLIILFFAIVLIAPVWSTKLNFVCLGTPLYFFTLVFFERLAIFLTGKLKPYNAAGIVYTSCFVVSILVVALEAALAILLAEKIGIRHLPAPQYDHAIDIIGESYTGTANDESEQSFNATSKAVKASESLQTPQAKYEAVTAQSVPVNQVAENNLQQNAEKISATLVSELPADEAASPHTDELQSEADFFDYVPDDNAEDLFADEEITQKPESVAYESNSEQSLSVYEAQNDENHDGNTTITEGSSLLSSMVVLPDENLGEQDDETDDEQPQVESEDEASQPEIMEAGVLTASDATDHDEDFTDDFAYDEVDIGEWQEEMDAAHTGDAIDNVSEKAVIDEAKTDDGSSNDDTYAAEETDDEKTVSDAGIADDADEYVGEPNDADDFSDTVENSEVASPADKSEAVLSPATNEASQAFRPNAVKYEYYVPSSLLATYPDNQYWIVDDDTRRDARILKETLQEFKIDVEIKGITKGPVVTMFELMPPPGIKLSKITGLQDNIALRLAAPSVRIVAPIPGKEAVGIEVPNANRAIVSMRELIETDVPQLAKMAVPVLLGKDITGRLQTMDIAQTPHLLIAGATGSGKSVCVNSIILSILYNRTPEQVRLLLVDPKIVELKLYNGIAHLLAPVITEPKKAFQALQYCLCEMERRYALLDGMSVRDIKTYNAKIKREGIAAETLPYIVIIIDEFADLMVTTGKELESTVARLCAMSRAVGIHLVLATQRPSINVITGLIKANIPTRIAFMVASNADSRIILDESGAEKLLGKGDMLYVSITNPFPVRIQGSFVSDTEVEKVVEHVKTLRAPEYIDDEIFIDEDEQIDEVFIGDSDPLYDKALEIVLLEGKASASYLQRRLKIGYNRAARIVEEMHERGVVGPANGSKPRDVIYNQ